MITARCPDCLSKGIRRSWAPVSDRDEEYSFICSNLNCPRAREPWSIILSRKRPHSDNFMLLGWDPREVVWFTRKIRNRLLAFGKLVIKRPRRLLSYILNNSKFKDPRYARINGRWIKVDITEKLIGQLEELVEEASR